MIWKALSRAAERPRIVYFVVLLALLTSSMFSFVVFPRISDSLNLLLDSDWYGKLGFGLYKNHSLSYYPSPYATVQRGPLYPLLIAGSLFLTGGWYPYSVQIVQCLLFALTCALAFWIASTIWNRAIGLAASVLCAIDPYLFWYAPRVWIEIMGVFLFTAIVAASLYMSLRPTIGRGILLGMTIALGALCKSIFLPFIVIIPVLMFLWTGRRQTIRLVPLIVLGALVLILPWTARNWKLTGEIIPISIGAGFACLGGDIVAEHAWEAPFSFGKLSEFFVRDVLPELNAQIPKNLKGAKAELFRENMAMRESMAKYRKDPWFFVKKIAFGSYWFWILGQTETKTLVIAVLELPVLFAFLASIVLTAKRKRLWTIRGVHVSLVLLYYLMHLPVQAEARYSVVLVPTMILYAIGPLLEGKFETQ